MIAPGDTINIKYTGYTVAAIVRDILPEGWVFVEQLTGFEDVDPEERPRYEAAIEFCYPAGAQEPPAPGTFAGLKHSQDFTRKAGHV